MKSLSIKGTQETPEVEFDPAIGKLSVSGKSIPEDASSFYKPIRDWIAEYCQAPASKTEMDIKMMYFNSSSAIQLVNLLIALEEIGDSESDNVQVNWYFKENDELSLMKGEEMQELLEVKVNLEPYS